MTIRGVILNAAKRSEESQTEEDPECGYNAKVLGHSIFTEAETLEIINKENIKDALKCHFGKEELFR